MKKEIIRERLAALRGKMRERKIDRYLIVTDDFHASEYVGDYFKCREYISGFDGSAGTLLISAEDAGLWTDGRYFLQAQEQLEDTGIELFKMGQKDVPGIPEYLAREMKSGQRLGYDGRTIGMSYAEAIRNRLAAEGKENISFAEDVDLVGEIWEERPDFPGGRIVELDEKYAGCARSEKLLAVRRAAADRGAELHLLASLDDIAWICNIRGCDIDYNPVPMAYMLIRSDAEAEASIFDGAESTKGDGRKCAGAEESSAKITAVLYCAKEAVPDELARKLRADGICIRPYLSVYEDLGKISGGSSVMLNKMTVNTALAAAISSGVEILDAANPSTALKAAKNPVEMQNEREAHIRDGAAVIRLLCWLDKIQKTEEFREGKITELAVADKLLEFRKEGEGFVDQSFAPIIASGYHGAIVHYDPTPETDIPLIDNTFLLMDTGGHYLQGTTDITRTVAVGSVTEEMKRHYTAVLRGNLNLAAAVFRYGSTGRDLDSAARMPLWELGLDFNHGTGHGVGYLLNVHEGPQRISPNEAGRGVPMEEGMLTSDEPGVYLEGQYGIRLENLMLCHEKEQTAFGRFMCFETVTMVPFDRNAILPQDMTEKERKLLNAYHKTVYEKTAPLLGEEERAWLENAVREI